MDRIALQIRFRCLCFFVPDETDASTKRMHVLMPDTSTHADGCCVDKHVVRIIYPTPFGGGTLDEHFFPSKPGEGVFAVLPMEEWSLVLGAARGGANTDVPNELVDITSNGGYVDRALLGQQRHPSVISRITLEGGGIIAHRSGATWRFNSKETDIIQELVWMVPGIEGHTLAWSRIRLKPEGSDGGPEIEKLPQLIPDAAGIVRLEVHHVMAEDFPRPKTGDPAASSAHFAAYYTLFDHPSDPARPVFVRENQTKPRTCMSALGRLR
jgi:hypothetical protein